MLSFRAVHGCNRCKNGGLCMIYLEVGFRNNIFGRNTRF